VEGEEVKVNALWEMQAYGGVVDISLEMKFAIR